MSWAKLDDQIYRHEKLLACTPAARWLFIALITYSRDAQLAGQFTRGQAAHAIGGQGCRRAHLHELMRVGLVEDQDPYFVIPDYGEYNPLTSTERVRKHRQRNADETVRETPDVTVSSHAPAGVRRATQSPSPVTRRELSLVSNVLPNTPEAQAICRAYEGLGGVITPKVLEDAEGLTAEFRIPTADEFVAAIQQGAPTKAVRTILYFRQRFRELNDELRDAGRKPRDHDWGGRTDGLGAVAASKALP